MACGLPAESRVIKLLSGNSVDIQTLIQAIIADCCETLLWFQTKDGRKGRNRPKSVVKLLTSKDEPRNEKVFDSSEDFEKERQKIINGE